MKKLIGVFLTLLMVVGLAQAQPVVKVRLFDTNYTNYLELVWNEDRAANQILYFITGAADRTITLAGNLTLTGANTVSTWTIGAASISSTATAGNALIGDGTNWTSANILSSVPTGLTYTTATRALSLTSGYMIPGAGTQYQVLMSAGASAPVWSTPTFSITATAGNALIGDGTNWTSANILSSVPTGLTYTTATRALSLTAGYMIPGAGTAGQILTSAGASAPAWTTAKYPSASPANGAYLRGDGTNFITSTLILPNAGTAFKLPVFSSANTMTELAAVGATGEMIIGNTGAIPSWSAAPTLNTSLTVPLILAAANLTLQPTGDLLTDPAGNDVLPVTNYDINIGAMAKKYLSLYASELWVETLVAQNTIATIGGRILVGPTTTLVADLAVAATTIHVKHNEMASGDRVYMEANGQVEFMSIDSAAGGSAGDYTYTVTRHLEGGASHQWYAGDAMFNTGTTGEGFMDLYSIRGIKAATEYGPTITGNVRLSTTYNDWAPRWAIGNLNGLYDYGATAYGFASGDYTKTWVGIDATNGFRIMYGAVEKLHIDTAGIAEFASSYVTIDANGIRVTPNPTNAALTNGYAFTNPNSALHGVFGTRIAAGGNQDVYLVSDVPNADAYTNAMVFLRAEKVSGANTWRSTIDMNVTSSGTATMTFSVLDSSSTLEHFDFSGGPIRSGNTTSSRLMVTDADNNISSNAALTAGYVPYATAAGALANGPMIVSGSGVLVTGAAAAYTGTGIYLDYSGAQAQITAGSAGGNYRNLVLRASGGASPAANQLFLQYDGSVGIGCSDPHVRFEVDTGTNMRMGIGPGIDVGTAVTLEAFNDTRGANIPMELRSTAFSFIGGPVLIGATAAAVGEKFLVKAAGTSAGTLEPVAFFNKASSSSGGALIRVHDTLVDYGIQATAGAGDFSLSLSSLAAGVAVEGIRILKTGSVFIGATAALGSEKMRVRPATNKNITFNDAPLAAGDVGIMASNDSNVAIPFSIYATSIILYSTGPTVVGTATAAAFGHEKMYIHGEDASTSDGLAVDAGTTTGTDGYPIIVRAHDATNQMYVRADGYGYLRATAWAYGPSNRAVKTNIKAVGSSLGLIGKLEPSTFDYKDGRKGYVGFIAEDLQAVFPSLVAVEKDGNYSIRTTDLIPYLVSASQELNAKVEAQVVEIALLKAAVADLKKRMN